MSDRRFIDTPRRDFLKTAMALTGAFSLDGCTNATFSETQISRFMSILSLWDFSYPLPNIIYKRTDGFDCTLDIFKPTNVETPNPVVIYIHGGGWGQPERWNKMSHVLLLLPYLALGMSVVHVEYRTAPVALAPAAVEDCRSALYWVYQNAEEHKLDTSRLVVTGDSAGGHLALMTGFLDPADGFDHDAQMSPAPRVSAIINYFGITDVTDVLAGPNQQSYAVRWFGGQTDLYELAERVSPLRYIRPGVPPVLTIHGDQDALVPFQHAVRLHETLDQATVDNRLMTLPGYGHGHRNFTPEIQRSIAEETISFLRKHGLLS